MPLMHVRSRRLLAIGLGAAALAAAGCGGSETTTSGDHGSYSRPSPYLPAAGLRPVRTGGDPAAELEAQRQAVEALNNISQLQYQAGMNTAGNFTP